MIEMAGQTFSCPSPDDCNFETDEISELTAHINTEHAGEYQNPGWPDTPAGRKARSLVDVKFDEDQEEKSDK